MRYRTITTLAAAVLLAGCAHVTCEELNSASRDIGIAQGALDGAASAGSVAAGTASVAADKPARAAQAAIAAARKAKHCVEPQ